MFKVHDEGAFRVYVYSPPPEHEPPHVHVECTRAGEVLVWLGDEHTPLSLWQNHHVTALDAREALRGGAAHQQRFLEEMERLMAKSPRPDDAGFERQNERAIREAREADRIEPRANAAAYDPHKGLVLIELRSGFAFGFPPVRVRGLESATAHELSAMRISPSGYGLLWDELNVRASLTGLMAAALNLREWAPRFMGQIRTRAKAKAARANGIKGGRPRRSAKSPKKAKSTARQ